MNILQNIKDWVKYEKIGNKTKILDVKQKNPLKPFKNIKKK